MSLLEERLCRTSKVKEEDEHTSSYGYACPLILPSNPPAKNITLELADGLQQGMAAFPAFLLPSGSYAQYTFAVTDARGVSVVPPTSVELGPGPTMPLCEGSGSRRMLSDTLSETFSSSAMLFRARNRTRNNWQQLCFDNR